MSFSGEPAFFQLVSPDCETPNGKNAVHIVIPQRFLITRVFLLSGIKLSNRVKMIIFNGLLRQKRSYCYGVREFAALIY